MSNDKAKCSNKFHKSNMGLWGLCGTCGTGIVSETKCEHRMSCELCGRIGEAPEDKKPDETVEQVAKQFEDAGRHTMAQLVRAGDPTEQVETLQKTDTPKHVIKGNEMPLICSCGKQINGTAEAHGHVAHSAITQEKPQAFEDVLYDLAMSDFVTESRAKPRISKALATHNSAVAKAVRAELHSLETILTSYDSVLNDKKLLHDIIEEIDDRIAKYKEQL